jgi:hypothetical protein
MSSSRSSAATARPGELQRQAGRDAVVNLTLERVSAVIYILTSRPMLK